MPEYSVMNISNVFNNGENPNVGQLRRKEEILPLETVQLKKNFGKYPLPMNILTGMLLGDAGIFKHKNGINAFFYLRHCEKQKEYLLHKAEILQELTKVRIRHAKNGDTMRWTAETLNHPFYTKLYYKWYPNNKKTVTEKNIQYLDPQGLAYWYMDDGCLMRWKNNPKKFEIRIATHSFTKEEQEILQHFVLENFQVKFNIMRDGKYYCLRCGLKEGIKFMKIVAPYIQPCLEYKLERKYLTANETLLKDKDDDTVRPVCIDEDTECNRNGCVLSQ